MIVFAEVAFPGQALSLSPPPGEDLCDLVQRLISDGVVMQSVQVVAG